MKRVVQSKPTLCRYAQPSSPRARDLGKHGTRSSPAPATAQQVQCDDAMIAAHVPAGPGKTYKHGVAPPSPPLRPTDYGESLATSYLQASGLGFKLDACLSVSNGLNVDVRDNQKNLT